MLGRSLALSAKTSDPQILIDCPMTDAPTVLKMRLCFTPRSGNAYILKKLNGIWRRAYAKGKCRYTLL